MGKSDQNEARQRSRDFSSTSSGTTMAGLYGTGAPGGTPSMGGTPGLPRGGPFGPGGLTGDREAAKGQQQQTLSSVQRGIGSLIESGGYDPAKLGQLRSGYSNFANTGGFNPEQAAAFRRNATSGVPAVYNVLKSESERRRGLTGGLGTGGEISQMARQMGEETARANTGAEVALDQQVNANKLAGLGGGAALEGGVASGRAAGTAAANQLFNTQTGEVSDMGRQILGLLGIDSSNQANSLSVLQSLSRTPGIFDNIMRVAGLGVQGVGAYEGGG